MASKSPPGIWNAITTGWYASKLHVFSTFPGLQTSHIRQESKFLSIFLSKSEWSTENIKINNWQQIVDVLTMIISFYTIHGCCNDIWGNCLVWIGFRRSMSHVEISVESLILMWPLSLMVSCLVQVHAFLSAYTKHIKVCTKETGPNRHRKQEFTSCRNWNNSNFMLSNNIEMHKTEVAYILTLRKFIRDVLVNMALSSWHNLKHFGCSGLHIYCV